jgi:DNA/RNA-binding domain of Phe-tRNA-synthetase-like protein
VVDIGNVGSIETGWPFGCYDRARIRPPILLRHGSTGERYEGIGKRTWHFEGRPVLADAEGPFRSPISDSTRSMITEAACDVLIVIYAPSGAPDASIELAMKRLSERLAQFGGAGATRAGIHA